MTGGTANLTGGAPRFSHAFPPLSSVKLVCLSRLGSGPPVSGYQPFGVLAECFGCFSQPSSWLPMPHSLPPSPRPASTRAVSSRVRPQTTRGSVGRSKRLSRCTPGASEGSICSPLLVYLGSNLGGFQQTHHGSCWPVLNGCPKPSPARFPTFCFVFLLFYKCGKNAGSVAVVRSRVPPRRVLASPAMTRGPPLPTGDPWHFHRPRNPARRTAGLSSLYGSSG